MVTSHNETDVLVVGGGPAGIAAAMAARRKGLRVIVADGCRPPIDKACGEGLMPDSIAAAARIGIGLPVESGFRFRGIRFLGEGHQMEADFPDGEGLGMRRTFLHEHLVASAESSGIQFAWETPVTGIEGNVVRLAKGTVSARWVVGADGSSSRVRTWAGIDTYARCARRFGFRKHFACAPWTRFMEIYWGEACQIYVTPVSAGEVCVALISRSQDLRLDQALQQFPELRERLRRAEASSAERGAVSANSRLREVYKGNIALIGDASGSVDAITGEGMCLAFRQAELLADALANGDLRPYARGHFRILLRPSVMASVMLTMDRWPWIRRRALAALAESPERFAQLLSLHVGAKAPWRIAPAGLALGWQMLFPS